MDQGPRLRTPDTMGGGQQKSILFLRRGGQVTILAARRISPLPGVTPQQACMAARRLWAVTQVTDSLRTRKTRLKQAPSLCLLQQGQKQAPNWGCLSAQKPTTKVVLRSEARREAESLQHRPGDDGRVVPVACGKDSGSATAGRGGAGAVQGEGVSGALPRSARPRPSRGPRRVWSPSRR